MHWVNCTINRKRRVSVGLTFVSMVTRTKMLLILLLLIFVHFVYISREKCRDEIKTIIVQLKFNSFGFLNEKKSRRKNANKKEIFHLI